MHIVGYAYYYNLKAPAHVGTASCYLPSCLPFVGTCCWCIMYYVPKICHQLYAYSIQHKLPICEGKHICPGKSGGKFEGKQKRVPGFWPLPTEQTYPYKSKGDKAIKDSMSWCYVCALHRRNKQVCCSLDGQATTTIQTIWQGYWPSWQPLAADSILVLLHVCAFR